MMNSMLYLAWNSNSCTRPGHRGRKHKHHPTCKRQELQQRKEHIVNCEPGLTVSRASSNASTNLQPKQNPFMSMANFGDWTGLLSFTDHLATICTDCILDFDPLHDFLMSFRRILRIRVDSASKQLVNLLLSGKERLSAVSTETRN